MGIFREFYTQSLSCLDILLKPEIMFWECRLSENGILIQLLSEETGEPIDAVVKVSSNAKTGGGGKYHHFTF